MINIKTEELDNAYHIQVVDNGKGLSANVYKGKGISVYRDMFEHFNNQNTIPAQLDIKNRDRGVEVNIIIPVNYKYA